MPGIMNLVWDVLLPELTDEKLPEEKKELKKLQNIEFKIALIKGSNSSSNYNNTYQLKENEQEISEIQFDFTNNQIVFTGDSGQETLYFKQDEYLKSELKGILPYTEQRSKKIASQGAWISESEFKLQINFYESPARLSYLFKFEEGKMSLISNLEFALFGSRSQKELLGTLKN
jgi:hypothetical protein